MKNKNLILITLGMFAAVILAALLQGKMGGLLFVPASALSAAVPATFDWLQTIFVAIVSGLMAIFGGSLFVSLIALALLVELLLLYPSLQLQLKQKKIHLFHKKLVNRFESGELRLSKTQHELDALYAVNETLHARGALLVGIQIIFFLLVLWGLQGLASSFVPRSSLDMALLARPVSFLLPLLAGFCYFSHSLIKISLKSKEDEIHPRQIQVALGMAVLASAVVFYASSLFPALLSVYFVTLISFGVIRYVVVDRRSAKWGTRARYELIKMLHNASSHKNLIQKWSRQWNHLPVVRHINFHLLEEAASMSFALMVLVHTL